MRSHALVGPLHVAVGADGNDRVLHAVEQRFKLALAGAEFGEAALDLARGFVECAAEAADFVRRRILHPGFEIAFGDVGRDVDDVFEAARGQSRRESGNDECNNQRERRAKSEPSADLGLHGFDIGERVGEANGSSGDGDRYVNGTPRAALRRSSMPVRPARAAANSLNCDWSGMLAGFVSESASTFPLESMMVARAPAA